MIDGYELVARRILKERFRLQKFIFIFGKTGRPELSATWPSNVSRRGSVGDFCGRFTGIFCTPKSQPNLNPS
jgi:hypothetical protein